MIVTAAVGPDDRPVPLELMAATVNVYESFWISPVTDSLVAVLAKVWAVWATPARYGVTTYPEMFGPPSYVGAVHVTVAAFVVPEAVAVPIVGVPGVPTT